MDSYIGGPTITSLRIMSSRKNDQGPFAGKGQIAHECLELTHTNVCGPLNIQSHGGYEYFITFIDDYSRFGYVYLLHYKSESFEKFKEFKAKTKMQLEKCIMTRSI